MMLRHLTISEQRDLARLLQAGRPLVWSDNLAPANVNIVPMQMMIGTSDLDRSVDALVGAFGFSAPYARQIVLCVLSGVDTGMGRGSTQHGESEVGGAATGAPAGANHDSASDE